MFRKEFAEVISKMGMIPTKDLQPLLKDKDPNKVSEFLLLDFSFFDEIKFANQIAERHELTFINLEKAKIKEKTLNLVKKEDALKYRMVPIQKTSKAVIIAIYDPTIILSKKEILTIFQHPVDFILTNISSWKKIYDRVELSVDELIDRVRLLDSKKDNIDANAEVVQEEDVGIEVITYVNKILADAFIKKVSDIHVESYEKVSRIRYRIDGKLQEVLVPDKKIVLPMISRIKIMAELDIAERRRPQDGRIRLLIGNNKIDYRVSTLPCIFGEKIVLRLLDSSNLELDLTKLGFEKKQIEDFKFGINQPFGMCLVTGPTGSGKTTTLYSALSELNKVVSNISTIEDPVEFNLHGINQVNVRKDAGLTFATSLKAFLRQDPDIIMVGEVRDLEVAEIAVEAALTGHLVLSTLHTNDAVSTVTRLLNMGIEPFLVVGSLNVVVAQRLCRKICLDCRVVDNVDIEKLVLSGISKDSAKQMKVYKGEGCERCGGLGYKGRVAIYEVLKVSPNLREAILESKSADELKRIAIKEGMKTLRMSALTKVAQGLTTLSEAIINSAQDKTK